MTKTKLIVKWTAQLELWRDTVKTTDQETERLDAFARADEIKRFIADLKELEEPK